jgi:hypothetical protein
MAKKILGILLCGVFALTSFAQSDEDALRFSRTFHMGTARFSALGGAFTALGGDLSTAAFNPAGIGVYRTGELSISPNLAYSQTSSSYMGNSGSDNRYQFGLSNIGSVGVININDSEGLISINLAASYNKFNTFSDRFVAYGSGVPANNSYMAYFASCANMDYSGDNYEAEMAYYTNLIGYDTIDNIWRPNLNNGDKTLHRRKAESWGNIGEYDFSFGVNVSHIFYFGATVGVQRVSFYKNQFDTEEGLNTNFSSFEGFTYKKEFRMTGTGTNFKVGFIVRPFANEDFLNGLRLGAAIHTPTFLSISDDYYAHISASFLDTRTHTYQLTPIVEEYRLETPLKAMFGAAYTFGSQGSQWRGLASVDYEYVNYADMKMRNGSSGYDYDYENRTIEENYRSVSNIRVGGELCYEKYAFRGGFAYYGNPYKSDVDKDITAYVYSAGFGLRGASAYLDFAYTFNMQKDKSYMYYSPSDNSEYNVVSKEISYDIRQSNFIVTLGLRF